MRGGICGFCKNPLFIFSPYLFRYPTGTYAYDVTDYVSESGNYTTVVTNIGTKYFCMNSLGLLVVYTDPNGKEIEYWINEGADILSSLGTSGGLTAEEATAKSTFPGFINLSKIKDARLWTVVQSGDHLGDVLLFNAMNWSDVYDGTPYPDLGIDAARTVKRIT